MYITKIELCSAADGAIYNVYVLQYDTRERQYINMLIYRPAIVGRASAYAFLRGSSPAQHNLFFFENDCLGIYVVLCYVALSSKSLSDV